MSTQAVDSGFHVFSIIQAAGWPIWPLLLASVISGLWTAVLFAVVFGLSNAVSMNYVSFMWPRYFGRTHLGRIQGVGQTITVIGASLGPLPLAISKDYFGSYDPMLVGVGAMPLFFAVIATSSKIRRTGN